MVFGSIIFAILFSFLVLIFITTILSFFKKEKFPDYEPDVSVIIPCYNEEKNIQKCLDAVYRLDYPEKKNGNHCSE